MAEGPMKKNADDRSSDPSLKYDMMVSNFIMTLTHRRPEKLKEIENLMKGETSTLEMFSFIWGLKEAHFKMSTPIFYSTKSDESSFIYWRLGNTYLQRKDRDLALKYFNLSIQLAPHPPMIVDEKVISSEVEDFPDPQCYVEKLEGEPGSHNREGWGEFVCLAYAYEARANLLKEMGQYKKCVKDIDIVLELGCPVATAVKLSQMRLECEQKMESLNSSHEETPSPTSSPIPSPLSSPVSSKVEPATESATRPAAESAAESATESVIGLPGELPAELAARLAPEPKPAEPPIATVILPEACPMEKPRTVSFKYTCSDPPVLPNPNPTIPALSSAVKVAYSKNLGRHLVASRDISHGEIVAVEESYCAAVNMQHLRTYCSVCLKRTHAPHPCPSCTMVVFCSEQCRIEGLAGIHWKECPILATLLKLDMGVHPVLALKVFLKNSHAELRKIVPRVLIESRNQPPESRGFSSEGTYDHSHYRTVYNLVTNKEKRGYKDLLGRAMEAFVILKLLQHGGRYFLDSEGKKFHPSEEDLVFTGSLLMHHMMNIPCNMGGVFELEITGRELDRNHIRFYGSAIFPSTSLMSHSCYASCVVISHGRHRVVKATRGISSGGELTCQYVDVLNGNLIERRARLLPQYYFLCRCEACERKWPDGLQYTTAFNLKCVKCHSVVNGNTKKCSRCNLYYNKRTTVSNTPNLVTYEYNIIKKKLDQALKDYKRSEQKLIRKGIQSEADRRIVSNLIELYDDYVELPTYIHVAAQSTYSTMNFMLASSAHHIEDNSPQCPVS